MAVEIILGILLAGSVILLVRVSSENSRLGSDVLQQRKNASQLAMQIVKTHDEEMLADNAEVLAMVIYYTDIVTDAGIGGGKNMYGLAQFLMEHHRSRKDIAKQVIDAVAAYDNRFKT